MSNHFLLPLDLLVTTSWGRWCGAASLTMLCSTGDLFFSTPPPPTSPTPGSTGPARSRGQKTK